MNQWAVVYAKPQCEFLAAKAIVEAGYRSYCPARTERTNRGGSQIRPLFPRYLFAEYEPTAAGALLHCTGVAGLLRRDCGQKIALLPGEAIDELRDRERACEFDEPSPAPRFLPKPGERVRILGGAWSRMAATVIELDDAGRVRVLLDLLGRGVRARMPSEMLAPA